MQTSLNLQNGLLTLDADELARSKAAAHFVKRAPGSHSTLSQVGATAGMNLKGISVLGLILQGVTAQLLQALLLNGFSTRPANNR